MTAQPATCEFFKRSTLFWRHAFACNRGREMYVDVDRLLMHCWQGCPGRAEAFLELVVWGEWRLGAGQDTITITPPPPAPLVLSSLDPAHTRPTRHPSRACHQTIIQHVKQHKRLLLTTHTSTPTSPLRQPSSASNAIDRFLAMPHHPRPHSQSERLWVRKPDQSFYSSRKGCFASSLTQSGNPNIQSLTITILSFC